MGGKGSGRKPGHAKSSNGLSNADVDAELNSRVIGFMKDMNRLPKCDLTDPDAIEQRFYDYLTLNDKWGLKPGVAAYAAAIGISRQMLWYVTRHDSDTMTLSGQKLTRSSTDVIKKHYEFLELSLESLMLNDKGNPVKYFFLAKNHFGYKDQSEHLNVNVNERPTLAAPEDVAAKYAAQLGKPQAEIEAVYELPDSEN